MNWKLLLLGAALVGVLIAGVLFLRDRNDTPDAYELTLLHTNDFHAHYDPFEPWGEPLQGGIARIKTVVDEIRDAEENVLLFDAGDQFQGTLFFTVGGAEVVAEVMNEVGYDGMVIGNHEFDSGPETLMHFIDHTLFPVISANTNTWADPFLSGLVFPFAVYTIDDGKPVGVIGLTTEHTSTASSPGEFVQFYDPIEIAQEAVTTLESNGIDIIIFLTHLGFERDLELAATVSGIDVIIGGHSHTVLEEYPARIESPSGEPVLVVSAGQWGSYLGRLDVEFSPDGVVDTFEGEAIFIDASIPEDESVLTLLDRYRPGIDALMSYTVGGTRAVLNGAREDVRARETNLGNLICDAMLWKTQGFGTTVAIQNGGGIRASIDPGEIRMGDILEVLPFGNQLTTFEVTGAQLIEALENGVSQVEEAAGRFPHVSGVRFIFDPQDVAGNRIQRIEIWDTDTAAYRPLDRAETIAVVTNNYLASGGDGYSTFQAASDRYDTGWLLSDALAEYLQTEPRIPSVEGRISEVEAETQTSGSDGG